PLANTLSLAEHEKGEDDEAVDEAALRDERWEGRRLNPEDIAVELEDEMVRLAGQHGLADIHERKEVPAPEEPERQRPEKQDVAHGTSPSSLPWAHPKWLRRDRRATAGLR